MMKHQVRQVTEMNAGGGFLRRLTICNLLVQFEMITVGSIPAQAAPEDSATSAVVVLVIVMLALAAYFLPSIVAAARKHRNTTAIFFLNLLLGWSGIAWIGALIWALTNPYSATVVVNNSTAQLPRPAQQEIRYPCPFCAEPIVSAAKVCRFCRKELPAGWADTVARRVG
jgi:hypothetical protein